MASFSHDLDGGGHGRVLLNGIAESTPGLRCRFGSVDVSCTKGSQGSMCCVPPSNQDADQEVLLQVLNQNNDCLMEDKFVYPPAKPSLVLMVSSCKPGSSCCKQEVALDEEDRSSEINGRAEEEEMDAAAMTGGTVLENLGWVDRLLPVWIIGAMVLGVVLGYYTNIANALDVVQIDSVSLPIAVGLWMMMWPVLCKVRYELFPSIFRERGMWKQLAVSLVLNWLVGPLLMTGLAWATLPDLPEFRNGLILVGIARCIAMVLLWNQMAQGSPEYCAILVAVNSVMQIVLFAPLSVFYLQVVSRQYMGHGQSLNINFWQVLRSVLIYLGAPLVAGVVTRYAVIHVAGREWFDKKFMAWFGPLALIALVYTIIIIFALQGRQVIAEIGDVFRVAVPMLLYFSIMWTGTLIICRYLGFEYARTVTQAFTASSNNFELAIAIAVGTFGVHSREALAATVGPLIEVPALLALVYVARFLHARLEWVAPAPKSGMDGSALPARTSTA